MKKRIFSFMILALILSASNAFALQCVSSQKVGGSDECWTQVKVSASETTPVTKGTILVYDFSSSPDSATAAFQVRVSTATTDGYKVAGIAQSTIATGDIGLVQVRGKGSLKIVTAAVSSGDRLFVSTTAGKAAKANIGDATYAATSRDKVLAFALQTTTATATADAFITIV